MGKRFKIRLTEQELTDLIIKSMLGDSGGQLMDILKGQNKSPEEVVKLLKTFDKTGVEKISGNSTKIDSSGEFQNLDLDTTQGFDAYEEIADKFISSRSSNLLGLNGRMFADAAKRAFQKHGKYVPVELAMAQLAAEGGFSKNPNDRPIKTKNPFNVGNVDSGSNVFHGSVQSGIDTYYDLIARNYLTGGKTASDLINNFVNKNGHRYASGVKYEEMVGKIANQVKSMAQPVYAKVSKDSGTALV